MNTTVWRWFPLWLIAAMATVFAVNGYMIYDAYRTFPGTAGTDGFDLGNEYKRVLATAQQQAALGWQVEAKVTREGLPALLLAAHTGAPLAATAIDAHAERPVGPMAATPLTFHATGDGQYQADTSLSSGQWDLMLTIHGADHQYITTRRVVVK